jgi:hypothetical protein
MCTFQKASSTSRSRGSRMAVDDSTASFCGI